MAKFYTVEKEINGKKYTAQFNGISAALNAADNCYIDDTDNTSIEKTAKYLFQNVIIEPKLKIEDFGADKIGEITEKEINGKIYKAKYNGMLFAVKAIDKSYIDGGSNTSVEKIARLLLNEVIIEPEKLEPDDFETMDEFNEVISFAREVMQGGEIIKEFNEVIAFAREVMQGNFRSESKNESTAKKKSTR